jgi:hypothetical protein
MAASKKTVGESKAAEAKERADAAKEEAENRKSVLVQAKEEVVDRYLPKLELSLLGTREEKVLRLYSFLQRRFAVGKVEAALEHRVQICDCCAVFDGRFDVCPLCGDAEGGMSASEKKKPGNSEADALKQILSKWPSGFERVTPGAVKVSPADVKAAKRAREEKPVQTVLDVPGETPPTVEQVVEAFAKILDSDPESSFAIPTLADMAGEVLGGWDLGLDVVKAAALKLVDQGRADRQGAMLRSAQLDVDSSPSEKEPCTHDALGDDGTCLDCGVQVEIHGGGKPVDGEACEECEANEHAADEPEEVRGEIDEDAERRADEAQAAYDAMHPILAVQVVEEIGPASAETLDRVVVQIKRLHGIAAHSIYEMGRLLKDVYDRKLYLQRRSDDGNPVYPTFAAWVVEELKFSKGYAYDLMKLPEKFTRATLEDPRLGPAKLHVLMQVDDAALRSLLTQEVAAKQLPLGQTKALVQERAPGSIVPRTPAASPKTPQEAEREEDEAPTVSEPKGPQKAKPEPLRGKAPEAVPVPKGERITTCILRHGRTRIPLLAKPTKGKEPKPAKRLADEPWAKVELPNGVAIRFSVQEWKGSLVLVQDVESEE